MRLQLTTLALLAGLATTAQAQAPTGASCLSVEPKFNTYSLRYELCPSGSARENQYGYAGAWTGWKTIDRKYAPCAWNGSWKCDPNKAVICLNRDCSQYK